MFVITQDAIRFPFHDVAKQYSMRTREGMFGMVGSRDSRRVEPGRSWRVAATSWLADELGSGLQRYGCSLTSTGLKWFARTSSWRGGLLAASWNTSEAQTMRSPFASRTLGKQSPEAEAEEVASTVHLAHNLGSRYSARFTVWRF